MSVYGRYKNFILIKSPHTIKQFIHSIGMVTLKIFTLKIFRWKLSQLKLTNESATNQRKPPTVVSWGLSFG